MSRQDHDVDSFCGITTRASHGVVDTAAEGGLVGLEPLKRLQQELHRHGLRIKWIPKRSTAKGVGGNAVVEGVAMIPIGLGGVNGVLETTVVQGDVPLLLPVRLLKSLGALIDVQRLTLFLQVPRVVIDMHELASGHLTVEVFDFAHGEFHVPQEAGQPHEFRAVEDSFVAAMKAHSECDIKFESPSKTAFPVSAHGGAPEACEAADGWNPRD